MIPRNHIGKGVSGAVRYVLGEGRDRETGRPRTEPKGDRSRVAWIGGTGFGFAIENQDDADLARKVMEFMALNQGSKTKPCEKDCVHLSLGWRQGEQPTREQMEEAARGALAALGMGNARAIFVCHNDERYPHLHVVASKINPETGRAYDLKGDHLKLSTWAEKYEREFSGGVICTRREETNQLRSAVDRRDAAAVLALMVQQRATFTAKDLDRTLGKQIRKPLQRAQFGNDVLALADVVRLTDPARPDIQLYTTRTVLEAEGQVLHAASRLAMTNRHAVSLDVRRFILNSPAFATISREQARAFLHSVGEGGLALIDGQAGTGKTFTVAATRQAYERAGYAVIGLAFKNDVAADMRKEGFRHAATIHSELFRLKNGRTVWNERTAIILDEAAMIDTQLMAQVVHRAAEAGAKLIMLGDDRQLSSIDRGGMFGVLKDRYGAAELTQVRRQHKNDDRRASEMMAEGNFATALGMYDAKGAIHWERSQDDAREALIEQWAKDTRADPSKSRFVFAYTNADVDQINADLRAVRLERGELAGPETRFTTKHGPASFSIGDRIQITGTDKERGLFNGTAGTIRAVGEARLAFQLDGKGDRLIEFDPREFQAFRHGYAGTIYKGQGRTLDQTYLYHSEHWRSASSYVALTRHRDKVEMFVATNTAADLKTLTRQMARVDDRRAASAFYKGPIQPVSPVTWQDLKPIDQPVRRTADGTMAQGNGPISDPSHQQRGAADTIRDTPRQRPRRDRGDIGRGVAPAQVVASPVVPPVSNDQVRGSIEPSRSRRRDRADIARDHAPAVHLQEQASRLSGPSAVEGWTEHAGLVPQQKAAQTAVRKADRIRDRSARRRAEVSRAAPSSLPERKPASVVVDAVREVTTKPRVSVRADTTTAAPQAAPVPPEARREVTAKPRVAVRADSSPSPTPVPARGEFRQTVARSEAVTTPAKVETPRPDGAIAPGAASIPAAQPDVPAKKPSWVDAVRAVLDKRRRGKTISDQSDEAERKQATPSPGSHNPSRGRPGR